MPTGGVPLYTFADSNPGGTVGQTGLSTGNDTTTGEIKPIGPPIEGKAGLWKEIILHITISGTLAGGANLVVSVEETIDGTNWAALEIVQTGTTVTLNAASTGGTATRLAINVPFTAQVRIKGIYTGGVGSSGVSWTARWFLKAY